MKRIIQARRAERKACAEVVEAMAEEYAARRDLQKVLVLREAAKRIRAREGSQTCPSSRA